LAAVTVAAFAAVTRSSAVAMAFAAVAPSMTTAGACFISLRALVFTAMASSVAVAVTFAAQPAGAMVFLAVISAPVPSPRNGAPTRRLCALSLSTLPLSMAFPAMGFTAAGSPTVTSALALASTQLLASTLSLPFRTVAMAFPSVASSITGACARRFLALAFAATVFVAAAFAAVVGCLADTGVSEPRRDDWASAPGGRRDGRRPRRSKDNRKRQQGAAANPHEQPLLPRPAI
jgi:hypothetical protein